MSNETPAVVVCGDDGNIVAQNRLARRMLGPAKGKYCWDAIGKLDDAEMLPCRNGCVLALLASGMDASRQTRIKVGGEHHHLSCIPVDGTVVCTLSRMSTESPQTWQSLTPREREILSLLAEGETTSSAAERLNIGESTVRTHVEKMRVKLNVNTRAAVVAEGFRLGYLD